MSDILDFLKSLYNADRLLELVRALLASTFGVSKSGSSVMESICNLA